ncbi:MAG: NAD-dependent DNA ligase LigA [Lachnospiraceae bacterium]|nr:NAD-dependent DNA ligase LigA [Lachnospiraceae bacterium]
MDKNKRMKELIEVLNRASKAYYQEDHEIMSNFEYDALYDELCALEEETGITYPGSPTQNVGYEVLSELPKEAHPSPMLSLDKTKEVAALADFLGDKKGVLSWKMDGLTVVLTYRDGKLFKAVTRGNGEIGEVITANAKTFVNVPQTISYKGELVIRGEAVIKYSDFERINAAIADIDARYKNPRNLCSGSVRQLDSSITAKRNVHFFAFNLVDVEDVDFENSIIKRFTWLESLGFEVVERKLVDATTIADAVKWFSEKISTNDFPSDGLVLLFEDVAYGRSLGRTAKFPRNAIAFKWQDEEAETTLKYIEWSPSRTGLINPVAVFEPVELEGTTVSRASVHNVSILEELNLIPGDRILVYKANMIIPQISKNVSFSERTERIAPSLPDVCPACGGETAVKDENGTRTLVCINPYCSAKKLKLFSHFVTRNAMNIDGISESTIEKFLDEGILNDLPDLYKLERFKDKIVNMEGFGIKSYENLQKAVETSRTTTAARLLNGLGIAGIGDANAKMVSKHFKGDFEAMIKAKETELTEIEGVGEILARDFVHYFENEKNVEIVKELLSLVTFETEAAGEDSDKLSGLKFVITGSLETYENRDALKEFIESKGGKVIGSVSANTSYLINNDATSGSSKNKKAKSLGIPIITEAEFNQRFV